MQVVRNSVVISNLQTSYNARQTQENTSQGHSNHNMSKTASMNNKEQMQANCNMKGMHDQAASTKNKVADSNLGAKLDVSA